MLCHQLKRVSHIESVEYVLKSYREQGQFLPAGQRSLRTYSCIPAYIDITVAWKTNLLRNVDDQNCSVKTEMTLL